MESLPAPIKTGDDARAYAKRLEHERRRKQRRRLGALAGLLVLGLAFGVIYATGFEEAGGTTGTTDGAGAGLTSSPGADQDTSALAGLVANPGGNITYNWSGRWGEVASQSVYTVDLDSLSASDEYFVQVLLTTPPSGFSDLQMQWRIKDDGNGGTCDAADMNDTNVPLASDKRIMIFDSDDSQVTFKGMGGVTTGLVGGSTYCIGVFDYSNSGKDLNGTFIRRVNGGAFGGTYPGFTATLNAM